MTAAALTPGSPEWRRVVTASKVAAILGVSPYESPRSLWHLMRGDVTPPAEATAVQSRGHFLENGILDWWCEQHPEYADHVQTRQYLALRDDLPWAAATPDLYVYGAEVVVDAKTSRDDSEWGAPGTDEVPLGYLTQLMWAMHLSGARVAYIALLTQFLDLREYRVEYDADLAADIETRCAAFYASLAADVPPPLDDHVATYESLRRLHPDIDEGTEVELDPAVAREFVEATRDLKAATARATAAKSTLLDALGTSKRAVCAGQVIAQRQNTAAGTPALYPARKAVDLDALPTTERHAA